MRSMGTPSGENHVPGLMRAESGRLENFGKVGVLEEQVRVDGDVAICCPSRRADVERGSLQIDRLSPDKHERLRLRSEQL